MTGRALLLSVILSIGSLPGQQYPQLPELIQAGKLQEAQAVIDAGLASHPQQPELLYWQAVLYLNHNRVDKALELLRDLENRDRALPPHSLLLGQVYESTEKWTEAAAVYRKLVSQGSFPRARLGLGRAEFKLQNYDAAIEILEPMANQSAGAEVVHVLGLAHLGKGILPSAARYLETAVQKAPQEARYHYDLGLVLLQGQRLEPAARSFQRASELQPAWPEAFLFLGRALHDLNRGDDARAAFEKAGSLNPQLPLLEYHLGMLEKGRGNFERAMLHFEKELDRGTRYPPCYYHLAELTDRRGQPERSRKLAEQAVELAPDNADYRLLAARLALEENDLSSAETHLKAALAHDPESGPAFYLQGRLLRAQGKPEEAALAFAQARRFSDQKSQRSGRP